MVVDENIGGCFESQRESRHVAGVSKVGKYRKVIKNWSYEC